MISATPATATTQKDVWIGIRVIDHIVKPLKNGRAIGIVYDPGNPQSVHDARLILESLPFPTLDDGKVSGAVLIDIGDLDDAPDIRAVILADHMKPYFSRLCEFGSRAGVPLLSADLDCVRAAKCTVGIASFPRVEVFVSTQQAQASGIRFSEAFHMMVTEY